MSQPIRSPGGRRTLLLAVAAAAVPGGVAAAKAPGRRLLWIRNQAGEELSLAYRGAHGIPDRAAVMRLRHLFRDLRAGAPGPMPLALIDVLSLIQEAWRHDRPFTLYSGFRTQRTNAALQGAAPGSLHLLGMAADVALPGVRPFELARVALAYARHFQAMGVGLYPGFVHVDIGPQRVWAGAAGLTARVPPPPPRAAAR